MLLDLHKTLLATRTLQEEGLVAQAREERHSNYSQRREESLVMAEEPG